MCGTHSVAVVMRTYKRTQSYFHQSYVNDYEILKVIHLVTSIIFFALGNWYCGIWALLQGWLGIPGKLIRLHGGTHIILIHKVFKTAVRNNFTIE